MLVLDEPTVGIDIESRSLILEHLTSLTKAGSSVVIATHYAEEVVATCNRVAILNQGRLLSCDRLDDLVARLPREVLIEAKIADEGLLDRLANLPHCTIHRRQTHIHISIEAQVDQHSKPVDWPWTLGEILGALKSSGAEVLSLNLSAPSLELLLDAEPPTTKHQTCKPGK